MMGTYQGEPGEEHLHRIVDELHLKPHLFRKRMIRSPDTVPMGECVNGRKETSIQPATTLRDEFGQPLGNIRFSFRRLSSDF
jgi:hypothetical protein